MILDIKKARQNEELIIIKAKVTFKTPEEGGKSNPITTGYRPNHAFEKPIDIRNIKTYIGEIQFFDQKFLYPGESKIVTVVFSKFGDITKYLIVGRKWFIYEVPRLVAEGEILQVE